MRPIARPVPAAAPCGVARRLAPLWVSLLLLGGCDGGLFGTGSENADAAAGPAIATDPGPTGPVGTVDGGDDAGSSEGGATGSPPPAGDDGFVNMQVTHDGDAPLLRAVNLTDRTVRVAARGADVAPFDVGPGEVDTAVALDVAVDALAVSDADSSTALAAVDGVSLGASTLTTLVVFATPEGAVPAVPLVTSADAPDGGVANVRVVAALEPGAAQSLPDLARLVPAGDDPGAAAVDFTAADDGAPASRYESVGVGDYELVLDDAATGVGLSAQAGRTYSLVIGNGIVRLVVDSDLP